MSKQTLIVVAVVVVVVGAGAFWYLGAGTAPMPPGQGGAQAGVANPASVNCVSTLGGQLELAQDQTGGAIGLCHLPDGRVCEEWALFRNEGCVNPLASSTPQATTTAQ